MKKIVLLMITAGILMMAGCGKPAVSTNDMADKTQETVSEEGSEQANETGDEVEEDKDVRKDAGTERPAQEETQPQPEPEPKTEPKPEPEPKQKSEPASNKGIKLNFAELNKLSNVKYSWYFKMNSEHKTPEIPSTARKLIDKYGGIFTGDTSKKVIYLTFDEGYENGYTPKILDTLKENDVKAAFFITGPYLTKNADLVKRMLEEGHVVGSHTVNHPSLPDVDNETLEKELYGFEEQFRESFGIGFKYMRPPMGEYSERVLAAASQLGYKTVFWSFAYRDWEVDKQKGPEYAYNMVMGNIHNGAVLLLHAVSKDNAEALDRIIKDVKAQGYEIMPLDL